MTLDDRAAKLRNLLREDGIDVSLTEARDLLIADFIEQVLSRPGVDTDSVRV